MRRHSNLSIDVPGWIDRAGLISSTTVALLANLERALFAFDQELPTSLASPLWRKIP